MFSLNAHQNYFLYAAACDMRKGAHGLSGLVRNALKKDPLSGDAFIFINKRRNRMKLLIWDRTGFVIYYKLLERGTFQLPTYKNGENDCSVSWSQLMLIVEGVQLESVIQRKRFGLKKSA